MENNKSSNFRFKNLDSIRTIAFLSTFLAHAFYSTDPDVLNSKAFNSAIEFSQLFSFGVPIFFVLSGFLISYLMLKEQETNNKFNLGKFYVRRILRIWPVYYIVIIIGFIIFPLVRQYVLHDPYVESANIFYYLTFLSNFDQLNTEALPFGVGLGPTWSVSVEEQFYLFWPLLLLLFKKKTFIIPILITTFISIVLTLNYNLIGKHTIYCLAYLSIGGFYGYLTMYKKDLVVKLTKVSSYLILAITIALFALIYVNINFYHNFLVIALIALLIGYLITYQCHTDKNELRKIPYLERIGKYTYGLYLYHVICNFVVHIIFDDLLKIEDSVVNTLLIKPLFSLTLSLILSYISYHYFEQKFLNLKTKFQTL